VRAIVLAGTAAAVVACGGSSGPTGAGYASRVTAICARLTTDLQAVGPLPRSFRDPARQSTRDLPAAASFLDRSVAILRDASARLHAVPAPEDEQALARQWLAALDAFVADLAGAGAAARRADTQGFTTAAFETAPQAAVDRDSLGQRLGLGPCPGS
jgi:hypothetical protein